MGEELGEPVTNWRLHDLRRTLASGLAGLGVRSEIIKRVLGHAANSNDVTTFHYNWHSYDAEAMTAVQVWAARIAKLIDPKQNSADDEATSVKGVEELAITEGT